MCVHTCPTSLQLASDSEPLIFDMAKTKSCNDYIPEELIFNILSWMPVQALLRFKTVCKSWLSTISALALYMLTWPIPIKNKPFYSTIGTLGLARLRNTFKSMILIIIIRIIVKTTLLSSTCHHTWRVYVSLILVMVLFVYLIVIVVLYIYMESVN